MGDQGGAIVRPPTGTALHIPVVLRHKGKIMAGKKSGSFDEKGIEGLAKDKPVVYTIKDGKDKNLYTGVAKRGRVEERLKEHLPGAADPVRVGVKVKIQQKSSIAAAEKSEARIIKSQQPPQNIKGK